MYQGPKAVRPHLVAVAVGVGVGISVAVGCGDDEVESSEQALKAGTPPPAQAGGLTYRSGDYRAPDNAVTDTRATAGFKLTYEKSGSAD